MEKKVCCVFLTTVFPGGKFLIENYIHSFVYGTLQKALYGLERGGNTPIRRNTEPIKAHEGSVGSPPQLLLSLFAGCSLEEGLWPICSTYVGINFQHSHRSVGPADPPHTSTQNPLHAGLIGARAQQCHGYGRGSGAQLCRCFSKKPHRSHPPAIPPGLNSTVGPQQGRVSPPEQTWQHSGQWVGRCSTAPGPEHWHPLRSRHPGML